MLQAQQNTVQQLDTTYVDLRYRYVPPAVIVDVIRSCDVTTVTAAASAFAQVTIFQYGCNSFVRSVLTGQVPSSLGSFCCCAQPSGVRACAVRVSHAKLIRNMFLATSQTSSYTIWL